MPIRISRYRIIENLTYLVFWLLIIAFSLVGGFVVTQSHPFMEFSRLSSVVVLAFLPLMVVFFVHNFFIAPILVYKNKVWLYLALTILLLALFVCYQVYGSMERPTSGRTAEPFPEHVEDRPAGPYVSRNITVVAPDMMTAPEMAAPRPIRTSFLPMTPNMAVVIMTFLMLCANLGVKYYFYTAEVRDKQQVQKNEDLDQQLQYLRYQINPHFFMNTLNNIHALVDIDPDRAKVSIVELSKLMRFVLYEGSRSKVALSKETEFLRQYVSLMKMRYSDNVRISLSLPDPIPEVEIPPLIFVTFVENAFKHGISYEQESFIEAEMTVHDGMLCFRCRNSCHPSGTGDHGGVGLDNVRKRLSLIYENRYEMKVSESDNIYDLKIRIPYDTLHSSR